MTDTERKEAAGDCINDLINKTDVDAVVVFVRCRDRRVHFYQGLRNPADIPALSDLATKVAGIIHKFKQHIPGFYPKDGA